MDDLAERAPSRERDSREGHVRDWFGTFLERVNQPGSQLPGSALAATTITQRFASALVVFLVLERDKQMPFSRLQEVLGLDLFAMVNAVETLREAGLLEVVGQPGGEAIRLTAEGHRFYAATREPRGTR